MQCDGSGLRQTAQDEEVVLVERRAVVLVDGFGHSYQRFLDDGQPVLIADPGDERLVL